MSKLVTLTQAMAIRERYREDGKTVVWTNGCFDLLHPGHIASLTSAKALGDVLIVGLNSDRSVRENKGPTRPVLNEQERAALLIGLSCR